MTSGREPIPDWTGRLWLVFGAMVVIGLITRIPVVGEAIAFGLVLLIVVGWIVSLFVKAARR